MIFKILYVVLIVFAAVMTSDLVWNLSDVSNALMALPNLVAVIALSGVAVRITKNYFARKRGEDVAPMLSYDPELNEELAKALAEEASEKEENKKR